MEINNVAVIGAGTMGHALAQVFALADLQVALTDSDEEVLGTTLQRIQANLETCLKYDSVDKDRAATVPERITLAANL
ncbi:MAG: 3-hydroxyacyl-CoA dehydrogenase, partial [Anaerolineae bacterium]|nr:3-hydroxyacyl-CoA dehydrogenase [Anaerolineae bacterium]NIN96876.1 3-hydroxyacyl-CoA dehydrogenase [Anaerolineae bacterium]NIQ79855.1 3-hydroxyacyl-CoA dehydrogenase [Anaerolineae bacterium]